MIQHEDSDDDECEGYFLRPVNEYNILDKIKLANQELFSTENPESSVNPNSGNRVRFRRILVDYEPEISDFDENEDLLESDNSNQILMESSSGNDENTECVERNESEDVESVETVVEFNEEIEISLKSLMIEEINSSPNNSDVDEICEEIVGMELSKPVIEEPDEEKNDKINSDDTEEGHDGDNNTMNWKKVGNTYGLTEYFDIFEVNSENNSLVNDSQLKQVVNDAIEKNIKTKTPITKKSSKLSNQTSSSQVSMSSTSQQSSNIHNNTINNSTMKNSNFKLNFRLCCETKFIDSLYLPNYNGYYSQYGLSKKELEIRDRKLKKFHMKLLSRLSKEKETKTMKSKESENAFAHWLRNKMKRPKNKTKNMYDVKKN